MKFGSLGLDERIVRVLEEDMGYFSVTEIQKQSIPVALKNKSILAVAPSGTGKTIAFLSPLIHNIIRSSVDHDNPLGLIIAPTRELAKQILDEARKLGKYIDLKVVGVISQVPRNKILRELNEPVDLVIGTPLKIKDYVEEGQLVISEIEQFVLDECDRLLEMGFYEDIMDLYNVFRKNKKQKTHLFSATLPVEVEKLANDMMNRPVKIEVARLKTSNKLKQINYEVLPNAKLQLLEELLHSPEISSAIIFCRTQDSARLVSKYLMNQGLELEEIHGGLTDRQRMKALDNFENGDTNVLVATDLIARGINLLEVSHVINFDIPKLIEDYVHRVGRTARAGNTGIAWNLVTPDDIHTMEKYQQILGVRISTAKRLPDSYRKSSYQLKKEKKRMEAKKKKAEMRKASHPKRRNNSFGAGWKYKRAKPEPKLTGKRRRRR